MTTMRIRRAQRRGRGAGPVPARRERSGGRVAGAAVCAAACLAALTTVTACGTVSARHSGHDASKIRSGCRGTVHGVVMGHGSLTAAWLPRGFRPRAGTSTTSSLPQAGFADVTGRPDPPRLMLTAARLRGPLVPRYGGRASGTPAKIQGHGGFLESGPPSPAFIGVYWKPVSGYVVSVVGYKVSARVVLKVARTVSFSAPGIISLPVTPGRIVSRRAAIAAAERAASGRWRRAAAKLSSWTEIQTVAARVLTIRAAPRTLSARPWRPVWAVLLTGPRNPPSVEVVDAASGTADVALADSRSWFSALTDRDLARTGRCPGGSTTMVPFGVLTRDEEAWPAAGSGRGSVRLVLSTVPAVNRAVKGLYGGCVLQDCSIGQLVWVTIATVRAAQGKTIACLPRGASVPAGYKPKQVRQYYMVEVPGNDAAGCGKIPASLGALKDLAPPAVPSRR